MVTTTRRNMIAIVMALILIHHNVDAHGGDSPGGERATSGHSDAIASWGHAAHVGCMLTAISLMIVGVASAVVSHRKTNLPTGYFIGAHRYLYNIHRAALSAAILISLIGVTFGILGSSEHLQSFHSIAGTLVCTTLVMQGILGACLKSGSIPRSVHRTCGRVVLLGVTFQLVTGCIRFGWPIWLGALLAIPILMIVLASALPEIGEQSNADNKETKIEVATGTGIQCNEMPNGSIANPIHNA